LEHPIEVEARFGPEGTLHVTAFHWRGKRYGPLSMGRRWEQGGERRFLVMDPAERVFEIAFQPQEIRWVLRRTPSDFGPRRRRV
jgi:hypothetical protein